MVNDGNLTISDTLEELLNNADVLNFADKYTITTVGSSPAQTYPGDVADVGELSVEQAAIYYGATNFVSPENINPGPNYIVKDTAQAIADGANSSDIAVANALFAATSVVADGGEAIDMSDAFDVQGVSDYDAANSSYEIADDAASVLADTGTVVDAGVSGVVVTDATGAGYVDAADGVDLSELEGQLAAVSNNTQADIEFRVEDSASAIASQLAGDNTLLDGAEDLEVDGGVTDMSGASDIQLSTAYDAANSSYEIADDAASVLADTGTVVDAGVSGVVVTDATGAGYVDAADGVDLSELEGQLAAVSNNTQADIEFRVEDSASAIASQLAGDNTLLDGAEDLEVDGGVTDMSGASDIQLSTAYDAANSSYEIADDAASVLADTGTVVDAGVSGVVVTDATGAGYVDAADGVDLSELEGQLAAVSNNTQADIEFRVEDSASAIASQLAGDNTLLDGAEDLEVDGGVTDMSGASDIQLSTAYDAANSSYEIADDAASVLADTGTVVDAGVSGVVVTDATGAGYVDAADGVDLSELEGQLAAVSNNTQADIEFRVEDSASAIASQLAGDNTLLDGAEDLEVDGGVTDMSGASDIQLSTAYDAANSSYEIADDAASVLADTGTVVDAGVSGVVVTDATGSGYVSASDGVALTDLEGDLQAVTGDATADINFRVEDSAAAIASELAGDRGALDGANDLEVDGGNTTMVGAADIQSSDAYDAANSDYTITDSASAILGDTATAIDDGVSTINVDGPVGAGIGVELGQLEDASFETGYSADINFNVVDDANDITAALSGDTTGAMDNARG